MLSNNNQDNNDDHRAGGRTHISPAMLPVGQLFGDCMTGIKTRNDKVARSFKSITRFI